MHLGRRVFVCCAVAAGACSSFETAHTPASSDDGGGAADSSIDAASDVDAANASRAYVDEVMRDNPAFYFRLEETALGAARSESKSSMTGSIQGNVRLGVGGVVGSSAMGLDGTSPEGGASGLVVNGVDLSGTNPFTVELWYLQKQYDLNDVYRPLVEKNQGKDATRESVFVYLNPSEGLAAERITGGQTVAVKTTTLPSSSTFHHVVVTYDGTALRLYVDDEAVGEKVDTRPLRSITLPLSFGDGEHVYGNWAALIGVIDEIAFYTKALDASRVHAHYVAAKR